MKLNSSSLIVAMCIVSSSVIAADLKPLAKVNGTAIPAVLGELMIAEQVAQGAPNDAGLKQAVREELVRREVLAQEARKKGFDKKAEIIARMDIARQGILIGGYLNEWMRANPVSDAQVRADYDRRVKEMPGSEYKARHILVDKEDEANAIIKKLQSGAKFEDLAKESRDAGSKDNGGDLGWSAATGYVKSFADALSKLEKGKFTATPVQTQFGYHVIQLDDTRKAEPPVFDEIKDRLRQAIEQQNADKHIKELMAKSKIE